MRYIYTLEPSGQVSLYLEGEARLPMHDHPLKNCQCAPTAHELAISFT
jgi:hypothetical protein